jgi:hypothetical protein
MSGKAAVRIIRDSKFVGTVSRAKVTTAIHEAAKGRLLERSAKTAPATKVAKQKSSASHTKR